MRKSSVQGGAITVICGSMFSGKTEELIRLVRRAMHAKKKVQVFKSALETRCDTTVIRTHDGICFNAYTVTDSRMMEAMIDADTHVVGIEEVQFFDDGILPLLQRLADRGVEVIAAGLDQDFRGMPFGFMPTLMAVADNVLKLHAICKVCGQEASRTQRLVDGRPADWNEPIILIGAEEAYEARCRKCHAVRNKPGTGRITERSANLRRRKSVTIKNGNGYEPAKSNGHSTPVDDGTQLGMFAES